jgi:uncharacterized membrane protein YhaH (DUF805 family)
MGFTDAIRDGLSKYATFDGRSSRAAYWWFYLFVVLVFIAVLIIDAVLKTGGILYLLAVLALLLPNIAVTVRRLHDTGRSGWWFLISFVPLIGFIVMLVFTLQRSDGPNRWGERPDGKAAQAPALA